jgi:hypothetical protein
MKKIILLVVLAFTLIGGTAIGFDQETAYEAVAYGVTNFSGSADSCDAGDSLPWADGIASAFLWGQDTNGYDSMDSYINAGVKSKYLSDYPLTSDGVDHVNHIGVDDSDAAMVASHGTSSCNGATSVAIQYSTYVMGNDNYECYIETRRPDSLYKELSMNFHLGSIESDSEELDSLFFNACRSVQKCVHAKGGYQEMRQPNTHGNNEHGLKIIGGFHGTGEQDSATDNKTQDFVEDSKLNGIGINWIDEFTETVFSNPDICSTALIYGQSTTLMYAFFMNAGFKDFDWTGSHFFVQMYGEEGCNPWNGDSLT